jgi:hypothetical protein
LIALSSLAAFTAGCQPPSETTREKGVIDTSGHALVEARAPGDNHHWSIDVTLRSASEGTYVLLFSSTEPAERDWFAIAPNDPALRCAAARAKGCSLAGRGDVVALSTIGPGGIGVLRATFDIGAGGWFRVMRVEGGTSSDAFFDIQIVSEALTKHEEAYRFSIAQRH